MQHVYFQAASKSNFLIVFQIILFFYRLGISIPKIEKLCSNPTQVLIAFKFSEKLSCLIEARKEAYVSNSIKKTD